MYGWERPSFPSCFQRNCSDSWCCLQRGQTNSSISKPREDLRTRSTFTEHESTSSPLHSSNTLLQSSPELVCDWSRVSSSRQTRSNVARMSVSTLGVYSKSGSRIDFMSELLGVLAVTPRATA